MKKFVTFLSAILISLVGFSQVISDFETGSENWHSEGDGDYLWESGTGNPGSCFRVNDDATGSMNRAYAPVKFLGDWSSATFTDYVSADIFLHQINGGYVSSNFVFRIIGPGGSAKAIYSPTPNPPFDTWITYSTTLDPANWDVESGTWAEIIQHVSTFIVTMEYIQGDEYNRMDNVTLSLNPVPVPIAAGLCSDFESGLFEGWSVLDAPGKSIISVGGNPGKYLQVNDGDGTSLAVPPSIYHGDWTALDNHNAEIHLDIKVTDMDGSLYLHDFFIKISGPGGEAKYPIDNSIEYAFNKWHSFGIPIEQTGWTIVNGTWSSLLNFVNDIQIIAEYINGPEVVGIDNFCISDSPPVTDFSADKLYAFSGDQIQFFDNTTSAPQTWSWDFGDGNTITDVNPLHDYYDPGIYTVSLTTTNFYGSSTETKTMYIEIADSEECLKFGDDFDDNTIHHAWSFKNGTWTETSERMQQTSNHYVTGNWLEGCFAIAGSMYWEEYAVSCDFMSTDNDYIGFVFNYQDEQNMYMFRWGNQESDRRISKYENGVETVLASDNDLYTEDFWHHAEIQSYAGNIRLLIDEAEVFSIYDNTFESGRAGMYCWGNQSSYFDNFKVECPGIPVDIKVIFEGAYNGSGMNTDLNSILPQVQPYNTSPWIYDGTESVQNIPPNAVDWLLVEYRDAINVNLATFATSLGGQAAFLLNDGSIVDLDGISPLSIRSDITQELFVVIWHRNHLPVLSANPLSYISDTYIYNFTSSASQAYNDNQSDLGDGAFGMICGDFNADGVIDDFDLTTQWYPDAGFYGFYMADGNLDTQIDNNDKNLCWYNNYGKSEQFPDEGFVNCGDDLPDYRDGQIYQTIPIGTQCWMAENLNIGNMINGYVVPLDNGEIEKYCYDNSSSNCNTYGGLYLWNELMEYSDVESSQGICPDGWHVPSHAEWCTMEQFLDPTVVCDDSEFRGTDIGTQLKEGGASGFEALLAGERMWNGEFSLINFRGYFWTSTEDGTYFAKMRYVVANDPRSYNWSPDRIFGYNVRCVLD